MKKGFAILLIGIYLFGATDAYQFLKIPMLVTHYMTHKEQDPSMSLIAFLQLHYSGNSLIDADFQQDMKLPFKTHETECCITVNTILPEPVWAALKLPETVQKKYRVINDDLQPYLIPNSIFQPPRA